MYKYIGIYIHILTRRLALAVVCFLILSAFEVSADVCISIYNYNNVHRDVCDVGSPINLIQFPCVISKY